jgi:hypothetical protein
MPLCKIFELAKEAETGIATHCSVLYFANSAECAMYSCE